MFLFKKMVSRVFFPVPLSLELIWIGLVLMWMRPQRQIGKWILTAGVLVLTLLSFPPFASYLLKPLESQYPPLMIRTNAEGEAFSQKHPMKWVVVLSGGGRIEPSFPILSQLDGNSVQRLSEGIALYNFIPGVKLLVSGSPDQAKLMSQFARTFGVPQEDLVAESNSHDTKDHALFIKNIVEQDLFLLVTEASHMPRSMALFHKQGLSPIAAPVGHRVLPHGGNKLWSFFPSARSLILAERAVYEYLGLAWATIRGQI